MDKLFTVREVSDAFGVSQKTIRRLIYSVDSPLPYLRIGTSIRFHKKDILAYRHFNKPYSKLNSSQKALVWDYENKGVL